MDDSTSPPQSTQGRFLLVILLQSSPPQTIRLKVPSRSMQEEKGAPVVQCNLATMQIEATFSAQCKKVSPGSDRCHQTGGRILRSPSGATQKKRVWKGRGEIPPLRRRVLSWSWQLPLRASLSPLFFWWAVVGRVPSSSSSSSSSIFRQKSVTSLPSNPPTDASFPSRFHSIFAFASFRWRRPFNQDPDPFSGSPPKNRRLGKTGSGLSCRRDLFCLKSSAHGNENVIRLLIVVKDIGFQNNLELRRKNL